MDDNFIPLYKLELTSTELDLPDSLGFPFYYTPHAIAILAAKELQEFLNNQSVLAHNFGLNGEKLGNVIGKMFGVLVVEDKNGQLGYLRAFSGKLGGSNQHAGFVSPIFDILDKEGFFLKEEELINQMNKEIEDSENDPNYLQAIEDLEKIKIESAFTIEGLKNQIKNNKILRDQIRKGKVENPNEISTHLYDELNNQSRDEQIQLKKVKKVIKDKQQRIIDCIQSYESKIEKLKSDRSQKSAQLQKKIFSNYKFLNAKGIEKNLLDIFSTCKDPIPPAGSGECAAPKLFQYAFLNELKPIALAEFWWGQSPLSEVRKHGNFYPACRGKCEPILNHMLDGLKVEPNPMLMNQGRRKQLKIIYEDDSIIVVNKPNELLSVPGKSIKDSVYSRIRENYPNATGPLIVHRLDMSTSGILILALTKEAHKSLQQQFLKHKIQKKYIALVEGEIYTTKNILELPLRLDIDDRPKQVVCFEHGKKAITKFRVLNFGNNKTRIEFQPITGRTHQLRVHSAHQHGLNAPIVGDDLYGNKADRLYLHASEISFIHPETKKEVTFTCEPNF